MINTFKENDMKIVMLLDGFDEMRQPVNLFDANDFEDWMGGVKVIITSRENHLKAYKNYTKFFTPNQERSQLVEYRINNINVYQIR